MYSFKRDSLPTFCILSIELELENSIRLQLTPFYELQAERRSREKRFNKSVKYETLLSILPVAESNIAEIMNTLLRLQ